MWKMVRVMQCLCGGEVVLALLVVGAALLSALREYIPPHEGGNDDMNRDGPSEWGGAYD